MLEQLRNAMKTEHPGKLAKEVCYIKTKIQISSPWFPWLLRKTGFQQVYQHIYSSDLISYDYHLFPNMKDTWLETNIVIIMTFMTRMKAVLYLSVRSKPSNTDQRIVWPTKGGYVEKLTSFDHSPRDQLGQPVNFSADIRIHKDRL